MIVWSKLQKNNDAKYSTQEGLIVADRKVTLAFPTSKTPSVVYFLSRLF